MKTPPITLRFPKFSSPQTSLDALKDRLAGANQIQRHLDGKASEGRSVLRRGVDQVEFQALDHELDRGGALLKKLRLTADRYSNSSVDELNAAIQRALKPFTANRHGQFSGGITADFDTRVVDDVALKGKGFAIGDELELTAQVTQSAQKAGLFLELGANASGHSGEISLGGSNGSFLIEVEGTQGSIALSFSSGQTLGEMSAAINSFTETTGVVSRVSGTGIALSSVSFGSQEFTSVKVLDDAGIVDNGSGSTIGIYQLEPGDFNDAMDSVASTFSAASRYGIRDEGQNGALMINGSQAELIGGYWFASLGGDLEIALKLNWDAMTTQDGDLFLGTVGKGERGSLAVRSGESGRSPRLDLEV